jgi:hypothetical protein
MAALRGAVYCGLEKRWAHGFAAAQLSIDRDEAARLLSPPRAVMSERSVVNQSPQRDRLTLARVAQIIGAGVIVGICLTVALLASTMVAQLLVEQVGQVVFEDGIVLMTIFGLTTILAFRLVDHSTGSRLPAFLDQDWRIDLSDHRVWTLGKWLVLSLIALGVSLLPRPCAPG